MTRAQKLIIGLCLLVGLGVLARPFVGGVGGLIPGIAAPSAVTQVTYVYEKDNGGVPSGVTAGLSELNEQGITATAIDDDVVNPSGQIPKQYETVIPAARDAGLPSLVVRAGERVLRTVEAPTTKEQILEAAK